MKEILLIKSVIFNTGAFTATCVKTQMNLKPKENKDSHSLFDFSFDCLSARREKN